MIASSNPPPPPNSVLAFFFSFLSGFRTDYALHILVLNIRTLCARISEGIRKVTLDMLMTNMKDLEYQLDMLWANF